MKQRQSSTNLRVLLLVTDLTFGGAETQVVRLASEFTANGLHVCVVSMMEPKTWLGELAEHGVEVRTLGMSRGIPDPRAILRFRRIVREFAPDVVHCHMFHANILGRVARLFCPIPALISTVHNLKETSEAGGGTFWKECLYRITDSLSSRTTIICNAALQRYVKVGAVPRNRLQVIPNGIHSGTFTRSEEHRRTTRARLGIADQFVWLAVGRLAHQKDYPNLFLAIQKLPPAGHIVLIAGSGPLEAELKAESARLGIQDRVNFLGAREDIRHLYDAADAYVMSSEFEGFSIALLEASCMEKPIVATDAGGNNEIVLNGITGYVVPTKDPDSLSNAMCLMMRSSSAERRRMGLAARNHCTTHFEMKQVVRRWLEMYQELYCSGTRSAWPKSWNRTHDQEIPQ